MEAAERAGVELLPGCEVTGEVGGRVVHLLAYGEGLLAPGAIDRVVAVRTTAGSATCASAPRWRRSMGRPRRRASGCLAASVVFMPEPYHFQNESLAQDTSAELL
jgi:hypothetical protein